MAPNKEGLIEHEVKEHQPWHGFVLSSCPSVPPIPTHAPSHPIPVQSRLLQNQQPFPQTSQMYITNTTKSN